MIADLSLVLGPGMTALTGETGAGKTLVVTAIELLVGGRADAAWCGPARPRRGSRAGSSTPDGDEVVLARVVPAEGRSRAYVDGRLAPVSALAERGGALVDLHGQHAHQSLLAPAPSGPPSTPPPASTSDRCSTAPGALAELDAALAALGGDARARAREVDLLRFQVDELDRAGLDDPDEDERLAAEEEAAGRRGRPPRGGGRGGPRRAAPTTGARPTPSAPRRRGVRRPCAVRRRRGPPARRWRPRWPRPAPTCGPLAEAIDDDPERLDARRRPAASSSATSGASTARRWPT